MADMDYSQTPGAYTLQTGAGPSFSAPGGGGGDLSGFLNALAARKAKAEADRAAEEKRRYNEQMDLKRWELGQQYKPAQQHAPAMRQGTTHWVKEIPGMGPVSVAPGTFGAHEEMIGGGAPDLLERSKALGLTPGVSGVDFSTLWKDAKIRKGEQ